MANVTIALIASRPSLRLGQMRTPELLKKLFEIERSIGIEDDTSIRSKLIEVEEEILLMQRDRAEFLRARSDANAQSLATDEEPAGFKFII